MNTQKQRYKNDLIKIWGREPNSLDDLAHCVIAVLNQQPKDIKRRQHQGPRISVAGMAWDIRFTKTVSNTHDCPIDGVTNWGGRSENDPHHYPGWSGRVWVRYAEPIDSFGSRPWPATLTYTGTGGSGGYSGPWSSLYSRWHEVNAGKKKKDVTYPEPQIFSWDYRFFLQDWPGLEANMMWEILGNKFDENAHHKFLWEDRFVAEQDKIFSKELVQL